VDAEASKDTAWPAFGEAGLKVKEAARSHVMLMELVPVAPGHPLLVAFTVFVPRELQVMAMTFEVLAPVPPSVLQVQPLALGVQLLALAVKLTGCPVVPLPLAGPATEMEGGTTVTVLVVLAGQAPGGQSAPGLPTPRPTV
jgi:hypothetical protein